MLSAAVTSDTSFELEWLLVTLMSLDCHGKQHKF